MVRDNGYFGYGGYHNRQQTARQSELVRQAGNHGEMLWDQTQLLAAILEQLTYISATLHRMETRDQG